MNYFVFTDISALLRCPLDISENYFSEIGQKSFNYCVFFFSLIRFWMESISRGFVVVKCLSANTPDAQEYLRALGLYGIR